MENVKSEEDFKTLVAAQKEKPWWREPLCFAIARVDYGQVTGRVIKCSVPVLNWKGTKSLSFGAYMAALDDQGVDLDNGTNELLVPITEKIAHAFRAVFAPFLDDTSGAHLNTKAVLDVISVAEDQGYNVDDDPTKPQFKFLALFEDQKCESVEAAYLKLLGLSHGFAKPRTLNLDGIFGILPNLAWSGNQPYELDWLRQNKISLELSGLYPTIDAVDKIPYFLHHVIPADNTRILESAKVRLGAHLADGTTLMPGASYINFNAGTLGPSMVEGRISSSATVGSGTDVGGGASIIGVLSGGNTTPITVGANCLLGANSVTGIPLGDGCIIDAGVTVLPGSKVAIKAEDIEALAAVNDNKLDTSRNIFKAVELSGMNGVHFRLDTTTGQLIAFRSTFEIKLNEALH